MSVRLWKADATVNLDAMKTLISRVPKHEIDTRIAKTRPLTEPEAFLPIAQRRPAPNNFQNSGDRAIHQTYQCNKVACIE